MAHRQPPAGPRPSSRMLNSHIPDTSSGAFCAAGERTALLPASAAPPPGCQGYGAVPGDHIKLELKRRVEREENEKMLKSFPPFPPYLSLSHPSLPDFLSFIYLFLPLQLPLSTISFFLFFSSALLWPTCLFVSPILSPLFDSCPFPSFPKSKQAINMLYWHVRIYSQLPKLSSLKLKLPDLQSLKLIFSLNK